MLKSTLLADINERNTLTLEQQRSLINYIKNHNLDHQDYHIAGNVIIFDEKVIKIFTAKKKTCEIKFYQKYGNQPGFIPLLDYQQTPLEFTVYPRIEMLTVDDLNHQDILFQVICDLADTFEHLHHDLGWIHGDPGYTNIGKYQGKYVLLDLDTMKRTDSNKLQYNDIIYFLEDLETQLKANHNDHLYNFVTEIKNNLQGRYITETLVKRRLLTREVPRMEISNTYTPDGFKKILSKFGHCK